MGDKTSPVKLSLPRSNRSVKSPSASIPAFHHGRIYALAYSPSEWIYVHMARQTLDRSCRTNKERY